MTMNFLTLNSFVLIIMLQLKSCLMFKTLKIVSLSYGHERAAFHASIADENDLDYARREKQSFILNPLHHIPNLDETEHQALLSGERLQRQSRFEREGYGWVAVDVPHDPDVVFQALSKFEIYDRMIPTIREANIRRISNERAMVEYKLSRFKLSTNVIHTVNVHERTVHFGLDPNSPNLVLRKADGFWHVETLKDRPENYCRVWLVVNVRASRLLPTPILDYAASRALPRATTWIQTHNFNIMIR